MGDGRLRELKAYCVKIFRHWNMATAETLTHAPMPMQWFFFSSKSQFGEEKRFFPTESFPFLVLARNMIMLQRLILHFSLHHLSSGLLREVINKGKFQIFSSQSGRGRLQEVSNTGI